MALDEYDDLAGAVRARGSHSIAEIFSAVPGGRQEVPRGDGHAEIGVFIHGRVHAEYWGVVMGLISEQEVLQH